MRTGKGKKAMVQQNDGPAMTANEGARSLHEVVLDGRLDISRAGELRDRMLQVLERNEDVEIDAGGVTLVDSAALQVLLAFVRGCAARGMIIRWKTTSDALEEAVRLVGLAGLLGLETAQSDAAV